MEGHRVYEFRVDSDCLKLVSVLQFGRDVDVTVAYSTDVLVDQSKAAIRNAIDLEMQTDEYGLVVEWKQPFIVGWDWLTYSRRRRF